MSSRGKEGPQGITTRNGVEWEKHRRIANKALLAPKAVANFANHINESSKGTKESSDSTWRESNQWTSELVDTLKREIEKNGTTVVLNDVLAEYAFSVISKTALGEVSVCQLPVSK